MVNDSVVSDLEIINELYYSIALLGGKSDILGTVGSWKDTLDNSDVILGLKSWNKQKKIEIKERLIISECTYN